MQSNPNSVMAVTFTNKAANEMKSRIQELLQSPLADLWCGTFHGLAHRTLKRFYKEANLISTFTVLDAEDQLRVLREFVKIIIWRKVHGLPNKYNGKSIHGKMLAKGQRILTIVKISMLRQLKKYIPSMT